MGHVIDLPDRSFSLGVAMATHTERGARAPGEAAEVQTNRPDPGVSSDAPAKCLIPVQTDVPRLELFLQKLMVALGAPHY